MKKYENYEKYEGKVIKYSAGDNEYKAKVALVDADIGITIVEEDNPNRHLVCLIMPGSPKWKDEWNTKGDIEDAIENFKNTIEFIKNGEYIAKPSSGFEAVFGSTVTSEHCAF